MASQASAEEKINKARGYKAALHNPRVSGEAKEHAQEVLDEDLEGGNPQMSDEGGKDPGNVARGLKASMANPNVTEEGKKEAQEKLEHMGPQE